MAIRHQLIKRPRDDVWSVLSDRDLYAEWVPGTSGSHPGEGDWPEEGATLRYSVRAGPWSLHGTTVVREERRPERLALEIDSGALGTARIDIEIRRWGRDSLVIADEHPLTGPAGTLHNAALDVVLQMRHRRMLARLADLVERGPASAADDPRAAGGRIPAPHPDGTGKVHRA
ncbi:SRPBCC family protein [Streptomyces sp. NPDC049040]|uniref:SRPBCC family protein n=1 Tax=Streptomyces sp. NPDC049040 TaxID=3365593 RepID=UPI003716946A